VSIRVAFNTQKSPPAPFVTVSVGNPVGGAIAPDLPAQLDTAADRTVIPLAVTEALGLEPLDEMTVGGFGGGVYRVPIYLVSLAIRTFPPLVLRVLAHPGEPWILLGRDVLNGHRILFDGPNLVLEIT